MEKRQSLSLRRTLGRKLAVLVVSCATFLCGYAMMSLKAEGPAPAPAPELVGESSDAELLIAKYDCWTGDAPADMEGQIPGHVVVTRPDAVRPVRGGDVLVSQAFEQVFDGIDHGLTIHAFCR